MSAGLCALRALVKERLAAAAEEIFELFERTTAEYEEELTRLRQRNYKQLQELEEVFRPRPVSLQTGVHIMSAGQEEVSHSQEPPRIKEDPEPCINQEEKQLQEFPLTPVCVKTEDDEDESCVCHKRPTERSREEINGEDCGADSEEEQLKGAHSEGHTLGHSTDWTLQWGPPAHCSPGAALGHSSGTFTYFGSNAAVMYSHSSESDAGANGKPFKCSECGKEFQRKEYLRHHMIVHTGEKPFCCPFCLKCFNQQGNLRTHIRIHTGEKPYSCSVCQKCFRDRGTLSKHMTTHTEQRPFSCTVCGKAFKQKGNLKGHMRTHTGDKPYKCQVCAKEFANMNCRNTHMRIHTGEKPFSCTVCKKQFSDLSNLSHHEKTHRK